MIKTEKNSRDKIIKLKITEPFDIKELDEISTDCLISIELPISIIHDSEKINLLSSILNNLHWHIKLDKNVDILSKEEIKTLAKLNKKLNGKLFFVNGNFNYLSYKFEQVIRASNKIHEWAEEINKTSCNGEPLSPFEKYLYAYRLVTSFTYNGGYAESGVDYAQDLIRSLTGPFKVCASFTKILEALCKEIGISCEDQYVAYDSNEENHASCCVYIKDEKYNLEGLYYSEPTWDSINEKGINTLNYILLRYDELPKIFGDHVKINEFEKERVFLNIFNKTTELKSLINENLGYTETCELVKEKVAKMPTKKLLTANLYKALIQIYEATKTKNPEYLAEKILKDSEENKFNFNSQTIFQTTNIENEEINEL